LDIIYKSENLKKLFPVETGGLFRRKEKFVRAVDGINLEILRGETFGIVGESGCGKTTLGRLVLRLIEPTSGKMYFNNQEITILPKGEMKNLRKKIQMIFQDPYSSLDPQKNIFHIMAEPLKIHKMDKEVSAEEQVKKALDLVGLPSTEDFMYKLPGELSGGQRQRIGIARALIIGAEFIVADEPVSMLDASVKVGIISLLNDLKKKINLSFIFITHEIAVAYYICDRLAVMYLGKIVEVGKAEDVVENPLHPYTRLLMEAIPPLIPNKDWGKTITERGEVPSAIETPPGCRFHPRCHQATKNCDVEQPELKDMGNGHFVACGKCIPESQG
jgi:peptide/nickel transport system ATP-binding protein